MIEEIQEADLVFTVRRDGSIKAIKNRDGEAGKNLDMAEVLEMLLPYQPKPLHNLFGKWIREAQSYLRMKAFW